MLLFHSHRKPSDQKGFPELHIRRPKPGKSKNNRYEISTIQLIPTENVNNPITKLSQNSTYHSSKTDLQNWWSENDIIALFEIAVCEARTKSTMKNLPAERLVRTSNPVLRKSCNYHSIATCRIRCRFSSDYCSFIPADYEMDVVWTEFPGCWNYVDRLTLRKGFHF